MKFISEAESAKIITHQMAYEAIREALVAVTQPVTRSFNVVQGQGSDARNTFGVKASATATLAGLKVGSFWAGNEAKGLPRHNSLILLFDQSCGKIGAAIEAGKVNAYRTAAADAVATDLLARKEASILAIFGTGHQARYECIALARIRPIAKIMIVGRDEHKAQLMAEELRATGLKAEVADAETACRGADIIVTATPSRAPLFEAQWVRPGTHISGMGADARGKQELPVELYASARLYCDLPEQARLIGEFQHVPEQLEMTAIGRVALGEAPGRLSDKDITIFDSSGIAVQDLYIGQRILDEWEGAL
ncbi:ornithine cyclodeaminase family protein [Serratia sp. L9]|uniref:ornithine cyclodeaminase family protein n=1 Tax=Serratia sp. L9 TaxID=3423946 RepID=UPI003D67FBD9